MRRKKDDKRVLRAGNGRQNTSKRKFGRSKGLFNNRQSNPRGPRNRGPRNPVNRRPKHQRKSSGTLMLIVIIALVAFVIGAGIGVSLSFDDGSSDQPKFENVTDEMTKNVNNSTVVYDIETDKIDYNENGTPQLNVQYTQQIYEEE